jgi:hypothetical protein
MPKNCNENQENHSKIARDYSGPAHTFYFSQNFSKVAKMVQTFFFFVVYWKKWFAA